MLKDKEEFLRQKKGIRNEADETAQQLINIYRQLSVLGDEAADRYNKQLLSKVNADVLASFKTIPGGEEVRDYYNFLTNKENVEDENADASSNDELNTLLPKVEEISPLWESYQLPQAGAIPVVNATPMVQSVQPATEVVTKTVQVQVGLDQDKVNQMVQSLKEKSQTDLTQVFRDVVIDSNIDVMHTRIQGIATQVQNILSEVFNQISSGLDSCQVEKKQTVIAQNEPTKKRSSFGLSFKNMRRRADHKFSVDMTDEE